MSERLMSSRDRRLYGCHPPKGLKPVCVVGKDEMYHEDSLIDLVLEPDRIYEVFDKPNQRLIDYFKEWHFESYKRNHKKGVFK